MGYLLATAAIDRGAVPGARPAMATSCCEAAIRPSHGPWNGRYRAVHELDFSGLGSAGDLHPDGEASAGRDVATVPHPFGTRALSATGGRRGRVLPGAARRAHASSPGPLGRKPSHLHDAARSVYAWPTYEDPDSDVIVGARCTDRRPGRPRGWLVRRRRLHQVHAHHGVRGRPDVRRAARAGRRRARLAAAGGAVRAATGCARHGTRSTASLYLQVGIGSGNQHGTFFGDHDLWRLPETDDALTGSANRYLRHRPAFRANDPRDALPPNLAGRMAAAFALAAQVDAACDPARARRELALAAAIYARAKTTRRRRSGRRHGIAARVLPGVVVARRHGAGRRRARPGRAPAATTRAPARLAAHRRRVGAALPRHRGRRGHAQPVRHERAGARRPGPGACARAGGRAARRRPSAPARRPPGAAPHRRGARAEDPFRAGAVYNDFDAVAAHVRAGRHRQALTGS